jgi:hypothetical protein
MKENKDIQQPMIMAPQGIASFVIDKLALGDDESRFFRLEIEDVTSEPDVIRQKQLAKERELLGNNTSQVLEDLGYLELSLVLRQAINNEPV